MKHLEKLARKHLGDVLLDEGLVTQDQLAAAEQEQARTGEPLGAILVESRMLSEDDLARTIATEYQLPFVELTTVQTNSEARDIFAAEDMARLRFSPVDRLGSVVTLAVAEMPAMEFLQGVKNATGFTPFLFVAMLGDIDRVNGLDEETKERSAKDRAGESPAPVAEMSAAEAQVNLSGEEEWKLDAGALEAEGWSQIFDQANESVLKEMDQEEGT